MRRRRATVELSIRVMPNFIFMRTIKVEYENAQSGRKITMLAVEVDGGD